MSSVLRGGCLYDVRSPIRIAFASLSPDVRRIPANVVKSVLVFLISIGRVRAKRGPVRDVMSLLYRGLRDVLAKNGRDRHCVRRLSADSPPRHVRSSFPPRAVRRAVPGKRVNIRCTTTRVSFCSRVVGRFSAFLYGLYTYRTCGRSRQIKSKKKIT